MKYKPWIFFIYLSSAFCELHAQDTLNPLKGDIRVHDPVMIKEGVLPNKP